MRQTVWFGNRPIGLARFVPCSARASGGLNRIGMLRAGFGEVVRAPRANNGLDGRVGEHAEDLRVVLDAHGASLSHGGEFVGLRRAPCEEVDHRQATGLEGVTREADAPTDRRVVEVRVGRRGVEHHEHHAPAPSGLQTRESV